MKIKSTALLLLCFFSTFAARAGLADKTLDIYWMDVEGGAATLIVTPEDESVLIDSGSAGGRDAPRILSAAKMAGSKKSTISSSPIFTATIMAAPLKSRT